MKKVVWALAVGSSLVFGEMVDGLALVINNQPVTMGEIVTTAQRYKISNDEAVEMLIADKLQAAEVARQGISVDPFELDSAIEAFAQKNGMSTEQLKSTLASKMVDWDDYRNDYKTKLLRDKLTKKITSQSMSAIDDRELQKYFETHRDLFAVPEAINALQYASNDKQELEKMRANPLAQTSGVTKEEVKLEQKTLNPKLYAMLNEIPVNAFTPVLPAGKEYVMFYIQEKVNVKAPDYESAKNSVYARYMAENESQSLNDYFAKLKANATIKVIRLPK